MAINLNGDIDAQFARYDAPVADSTEGERWITEPIPWSELEEFLNRNSSQ
jgi:hypothetical protein